MGLNWVPLNLKSFTLQLCHSDFRFSPMKFQVFNSNVEALVVLMFWLDYFREFHLAHNGIGTWDLWISCPAVKQYAAVTSGFLLWQFQEFITGAKEIVVVLFWLDLWEIFFLPTVNSGFYLWKSHIFNPGAERLVVVVFRLVFRYHRGPKKTLWPATANIWCPCYHLINHLINSTPLTSGTIDHMTIWSSRPSWTSVCVELSLTYVHHLLTICFAFNTWKWLKAVIPSGDELYIPYVDNAIILILLINDIFLTIEG